MEQIMKQQTISDLEYSARKRRTKREDFLDIMEEVIPWEEWISYIKPYYYKGKRGRPPKGIEKMLKMYLLQNWFSLSDEGVEEAIYDSYAMRKFMGIDFFEEQVPDATTLLKFRRIIEQNNVGEVLFNAISTGLEKSGHIMRGGTIVDATIVDAPSSTKNQEKARDPEMKSVKKGSDWHFGMKVHIGVDAGSGYVHSIEATPANEHDITVASKLIRDDDNVVYGDSGYIGIQKREEILQNEDKSHIEYRINRRPKNSIKKQKGVGKQWERHIEHQKSAVRCKVEHPFQIVKRYFGYNKVVYRGIQKNLNRFYILFGCANLLLCVRAGRDPGLVTG